MVTSFSGGRSRSTRREPPTMAKQLVSFITCGCESSAPFLAHLALGHVSYCQHFSSVVCRPSFVVRHPSVNISHFNLLLRNHWANCSQTLVEWSLDGPFQNCVQWTWLPTKMAAKLKIEKGGDEIEIVIVHCCFSISLKWAQIVTAATWQWVV